MTKEVSNSRLYNSKLELPGPEAIVKTFAEISESLDLNHKEKIIRKTVIYEMTDGMRTSTTLNGAEAYFDGGIFALRMIDILRILGVEECYINVIEEKHKERSNYNDIFQGLQKLYPIYEKYAADYNVKLKFLGNLKETIEPKGFEGNFAKHLMDLEEKTKSNSKFVANFLINYSLNWAMKNQEVFNELSNIDVTVRHTKMQYPTGMMLPPKKSDFSSFLYVQQGSNSKTWSDFQLIFLVALAMRSKMLNDSSQFLKQYKKGESDIVRSQRETELYFVHRRPFVDRILKKIQEGNIENLSVPLQAYPPNIKRVIIAGPYGPEIYEF